MYGHIIDKQMKIIKNVKTLNLHHEEKFINLCVNLIFIIVFFPKMLCVNISPDRNARLRREA